MGVLGPARRSRYAQHLLSYAKLFVSLHRFIFLSFIERTYARRIETPERHDNGRGHAALFTRKGHSLIKKHVKKLKDLSTKKG